MKFYTCSIAWQVSCVLITIVFSGHVLMLKYIHLFFGFQLMETLVGWSGSLSVKHYPICFRIQKTNLHRQREENESLCTQQLCICALRKEICICICLKEGNLEHHLYLKWKAAFTYRIFFQQPVQILTNVKIVIFLRRIVKKVISKLFLLMEEIKMLVIFLFGLLCLGLDTVKSQARTIALIGQTVRYQDYDSKISDIAVLGQRHHDLLIQGKTITIENVLKIGEIIHIFSFVLPKELGLLNTARMQLYVGITLLNAVILV